MLLPPARYGDDVRALTVRLGAQPATRLVTVNARQADIEQNGIRLEGSRFPYPGLIVVRRRRFASECPHQRGQPVCRFRIVVDDQHTQRDA